MARKKRPTPIRSKANADAIVDALCAGKPLAQIVRELGIGLSSVYDWKDEDDAFAGRIARAREIGFDVIASDILPIADDLADEPASRRVRVEARLKLLAKWDPKRYGEKIDLTSSDRSMSPPSLADFYGGMAKKDDG